MEWDEQPIIYGNPVSEARRPHAEEVSEALSSVAPAKAYKEDKDVGCPTNLSGETNTKWLYNEQLLIV